FPCAIGASIIYYDDLVRYIVKPQLKIQVLNSGGNTRLFILGRYNNRKKLQLVVDCFGANHKASKSEASQDSPRHEWRFQSGSFPNRSPDANPMPALRGGSPAQSKADRMVALVGWRRSPVYQNVRRTSESVVAVTWCWQ